MANAVQGALDGTLYNTVTSSWRNLFNSVVGNVTNYNPEFLEDKTLIAPPVSQDLNKTPTVTEFLQSATSLFTYKGIPDGAKPFIYNNQQLGIVDSATGMAAKVWVTAENQIIIAYQGTGGGATGLTNPITSISQVFQDVGIAAKAVTPGEKDAVKFAQFVVDQAQKQGYNTNNIFVTGHSLGAIEAEYVAQQTGLGGIAFNSTGIPVSTTTKGDGSNFVNVLQYGDPVSNYASDVQGEQPFAPTYVQSGGVLPHYGHKVFTGSITDQQTLSDVSQQQWNAGTISGKIQAASYYLNNGILKLHTPNYVASNLGVDLGLKTFTILNGQTINLPFLSKVGSDAAAFQKSTQPHGAVLNVGNDNILQFLSADAQHSDYHSSSLPPSLVA